MCNLQAAYVLATGSVCIDYRQRMYRLQAAYVHVTGSVCCHRQHTSEEGQHSSSLS